MLARVYLTCASFGLSELDVGSVADSIAIENFLAMLDEGRKYGL